jgi:magnesium transporter
MPELHWAYGYPMMLLGTALLCFVLFRMFRRNRWL